MMGLLISHLTHVLRCFVLEMSQLPYSILLAHLYVVVVIVAVQRKEGRKMRNLEPRFQEPGEGPPSRWAGAVERVSVDPWEPF